MVGLGGRREDRTRTRHGPGGPEAFPEIAPDVDPFAQAVAGVGVPLPTPSPDTMPGLQRYDDIDPAPPDAKFLADPKPPPDDIPSAVAALLKGFQDCCDALPERIAHAVEQRLVTSRGAVVQPHPTCAQPVRSNDVDDTVLAFNLPSTDPVGTRTTILRRVMQPGQTMVIKGINWEFALDRTVQRPSDPGDQIVVHVLVDGRPVGTAVQGDDLPTGGTRNTAYSETRRPPGPGGIDGLSAAQLYVREGQCLEIIAERVTPPTGQAAIDHIVSARWKGWEWSPTIFAEGATGAGAY